MMFINWLLFQLIFRHTLLRYFCSLYFYLINHCLSDHITNAVNYDTHLTESNFQTCSRVLPLLSLSYSWLDDLPATLSTIMQDIIDDNPVDVSQSILHYNEGVDLLTSNIELPGLEVRRINTINYENMLKTDNNEVKRITIVTSWMNSGKLGFSPLFLLIASVLKKRQVPRLILFLWSVVSCGVWNCLIQFQNVKVVCIIT